MNLNSNITEDREDTTCTEILIMHFFVILRASSVIFVQLDFKRILAD